MLPDGQMIDGRGVVRENIYVDREQLLKCFPGGRSLTETEPKTAAPRPKLTASFAKIEKAIEAELGAGGTIDNLSPGERNKRLTDQMKAMGLKESGIPDPRTFRRYFKDPSRKAAKPDKSG
jgi:hypothetical protein